MQEWGSPNDAEILIEIRRGNKKALMRLYKMNYPSVRKYVMQNNGREEDVDDLVQEATVVVWQNASKPTFELTSKLSTYFMAICKNLWLKQLQRQSRFSDESHIKPENMTVGAETPKIDLSKVVDMVNELGETCRDVLTLFYFEGLDMEGIAQRMNFANSDTAKAKKYQCFKKLESMFKAKYKKEDFLN